MKPSAQIFDQRNPLWRIQPSADVAQRLVVFWRRIGGDGELVHNFTDMKKLMAMDPAAAEELYLAGTTWAARSSTAAKIFASARSSPGPMSASGMPNRCQRPPARAR
jgi:hypothetical protein